MLFQLQAGTKCTVLDGGDALRKSNPLQFTAVEECPGSDTGQAGWEGDIRQIGAVAEGLLVDILHAVREADGGDTAGLKGTAADMGDAFRERDGSDRAAEKRLCPNSDHGMSVHLRRDNRRQFIALIPADLRAAVLQQAPSPAAAGVFNGWAHCASLLHSRSKANFTTPVLLG